MGKSIKVHQKKRGRGRPATGRDPAVTIRIPEKVLTAAKRWATSQGIKTRSETIVRLVEIGLAGGRKIPVFRASDDGAEE
jgi:hypothetical protein